VAEQADASASANTRSPPDVPGSIAEAAAAMRAGTLNPVELLELCLSRIARLDRDLRAWVVVDRDGARAAALTAADELCAGMDRGPLHGIPVGIKDIFDVAGMPTRAFSALRDGRTAEDDSFAVDRLRKAGAVIVGKTHTAQLVYSDPPPTRNPWDLGRVPGVSSSGSVAAVAAGMCLAATASQTGGSITRPSCYCGVTGLKPTLGRISVRGVLPLAYSLDTVGVITRTVPDAAMLLSVLSDQDPADPHQLPAATSDFLSAVKFGSARPPRAAVLNGFEATGPVGDCIAAALGRLTAAGMALGRADLGEDVDRQIRLHRKVMAVEAAELHGAAFAERPGEFLPRLTDLLKIGLSVPAVEYVEARRYQALFRAAVVRAMDAANAEVLITPASPNVAPSATADAGFSYFNWPFSYAGTPTVMFPCGLVDGLPMGLQVIARPWAEGDLLAAAAWMERTLGVVGSMRPAM
jgi:aspartyl-tRNA(Asn)/glutamyl-tRNA(Gln) amidotransferase subunit A